TPSPGDRDDPEGSRAPAIRSADRVRLPAPGAVRPGRSGRTDTLRVVPGVASRPVRPAARCRHREEKHAVDLYEYRARDLIEKHGVPVLGGVVAEDPAAAKAGAEKLGTPVVVVKAQVKTGGRGKAGGVKIAKSPEEAQQKASASRGTDTKGHHAHRGTIA